MEKRLSPVPARTSEPEPHSRQTFTASVNLLQVLVGDRPTWKSADHPFRQDARLQLSGIPTLMQWTPDGPGAQLGAEVTQSGESHMSPSVAIGWQWRRRASTSSRQACA